MHTHTYAYMHIHTRTRWLVDWLVCWLIGWLAGWLVGWLVSRMVGRSVVLRLRLQQINTHDFDQISIPLSRVGIRFDINFLNLLVLTQTLIRIAMEIRNCDGDSNSELRRRFGLRNCDGDSNCDKDIQQRLNKWRSMACGPLWKS